MFNESLSQVAVIGNREWFYHAACRLPPFPLSFFEKKKSLNWKYFFNLLLLIWAYWSFFLKNLRG